MIPNIFKHALISDATCRVNKLWLVTDWSRRWFIEWKWQGQPFRSRMMFRFDPQESFVIAKSFDEDVVPTFKFGKEK